jgi:hypothetical protein
VGIVCLNWSIVFSVFLFFISLMYATAKSDADDARATLVLTLLSAKMILVVSACACHGSEG